MDATGARSWRRPRSPGATIRPGLVASVPFPTAPAASSPSGVGAIVDSVRAVAEAHGLLVFVAPVYAVLRDWMQQ
jgi:hypothetical protein